MAARKTAGPPADVSTPITLVALVAAPILAIRFGAPGAVIVWVALLVAAWMANPPLLTGKASGAGAGTAPANETEEKDLAMYRVWSDLRWKLVTPGLDWLPGWPVRLTWLAAVPVAVIVSLTPYHPELPWFTWMVDAGAAVVVVAQFTASWRAHGKPDDPCPPVALDTLEATVKAGPAARLATMAGAGLVAVVVGLIVPAPWRELGPVLSAAPYAFWGLLVPTAVLGSLAFWWRETAQEQWRATVLARAAWKPRWAGLKIDPPPHLISTRKVGPATFDIFQVATGALGLRKMVGELVPRVGSNSLISILEQPDTDSQGQPVPGTIHPTLAEIAVWPADQVPDLGDPGVDDELVTEWLRAAWARGSDETGIARQVVTEVQRVTDDGATPAWKVAWFSEVDLPASALRFQYAGGIAGAVQTGLLIDHRADGGRGAAYLGHALDDPEAQYADPSVTAKALANIAEEDVWRGRWAAVLKQGVNAPVPHFDTFAQGKLPGGETLSYLGFTVLHGEKPQMYMGLEAALATTFPGGSNFTSIQHFTQQVKDGSRHAMGFAVVWSPSRVPSLSRLSTTPGSKAHQWAIGGLINAAFKSARLSSPEVISARQLTTREAREHLWAVDVRLYDGVTLADVRGAAQRIRQELAVPWLRIDPHAHGVTIFAGPPPARCRLAREKVDRQVLTSLDWAQAWADSKVVGSAGALPKLTAVDVVPENDVVQILDFDLPPGVDLPTVRAAVPKLRTASGNDFISVRPGDTASKVRLFVSEHDPMPTMAPFDYKVVDSSVGLPFATGVEGVPVEFVAHQDVHLMVAGTTGGGKAQPLDALIPVPVSDRFSTGWARNADLRIGDEVFTRDGATTAIIGFSPTTLEPTYRIHLSDGQVVECGPNHMWKVADAPARMRASAARKSHLQVGRLERLREVERLHNLAASIPAGTCATLPDIARLAGLHPFSLYQVDLGLEALASVVAVPTAKAAAVFDTSALARSFRRTGDVRFDNRTLTTGQIESVAGLGWATSRDVADALAGGSSSRHQRGLVQQAIRQRAIASRPGTAKSLHTVYPVDEVLTLLADRLDARSQDNTRPAETIVSTSEMFASQVHVSAGGSRRAANYAIRLARPLELPDMNLPVDPYVLGAWLGDGHSYGGGFTSADPEIVDQIRAAGFEVRDLAGKYQYGIRGLLPLLRTVGVLRNKHIPATYLRASKAQRLALLQGLMDTDGSIRASGGCELCLCDKRLADGALELIRSLGIRAAVRRSPAMITEADPDRPGHTRRRVTSTRYRIKFTTDQPVFRVTRKAARLPLPGSLRETQGWVYVEAITRHDPQPMRCLKVSDPEHLYLTDGFIPTHNSVTLQAIIFGAVVRGWDLYLADPVKAAADFQFARPYARAMSVDVFESVAMMKAVYEEVSRRKKVNAAHGVGSYLDLPGDVRPPHIVLVLDEFTSLVMADVVPGASNDVEVDDERDRIIAMNAARTQIGALAGRIAREARSAGVTLVLATQKLNAKILDPIPGSTDLRANMSRLLLGKATFGDMQSALRAPTEAPELGEVIPKGRGIWEPSTSASVLIQSWFEPGGQQVLAAELAARVQPLAPDEVLVLPREGDPAVVDLGEIVLELDPEDVVDEPGDDVPAWAKAWVNEDAHDVQDTGDEPEPSGPVLAIVHGDEHSLIVTRPGRQDEPVALDPSGSSGRFGWGPLRAVVQWLDANPVDGLVWFDDRLEDADEQGVARVERVIDVLDEIGVPCVANPEPDEVDEFVAELGRADEPATPENLEEPDGPVDVAQVPAPPPGDAQGPVDVLGVFEEFGGFGALGDFDALWGDEPAADPALVVVAPEPEVREPDAVVPQPPVQVPEQPEVPAWLQPGWQPAAKTTGPVRLTGPVPDEF